MKAATVFLGVDSQVTIDGAADELGWIISSSCVNVPMAFELARLAEVIRPKVELVSWHRGCYRETARGSALPYAVIAEQEEGLERRRITFGPRTVLRPGDCLELRVRVLAPSRVMAHAQGVDLSHLPLARWSTGILVGQ